MYSFLCCFQVCSIEKTHFHIGQKFLFRGDLIIIISYEVSLFFSAHPDDPIQSLRAFQSQEDLFSLTGVSVS